MFHRGNAQQRASSWRAVQLPSDLLHGLWITAFIIALVSAASKRCPSDGRTLSEPLRLKFAQRNRPASGIDWDSAVRRKPVVRSGQQALGYGFHPGDDQRG